MMNVFKIENRRIWIRWGVVGVLFLVAGISLTRSILGEDNDAANKAPTNVKVKSVLCGNIIKVKHYPRVIYAGIRTPFEDESLYEEAKQRNTELVDGKKLRLRYGETDRDDKGRLVAYAFLDDAFINDILVREGLAFVRLTTSTRRFADRLLDAQREAREDRRGIWQDVSESTEESYPADSKYGNFHRDSCPEVPKIKPDRLVTLESKEAAFDAGYAPCKLCSP